MGATMRNAVQQPPGGGGELVSAEPARRVREMAEIAAGTALLTRLRGGSLDAIFDAMEETPPSRPAIESTWNNSASAARTS